MGATTVLPPSLLPRRCANADLHSCAPRVRINPACMANPAATKKPRSPGSVRVGEPPAKRVGDAGEPRLAAAVNKKRPCSGRGGEPPAKRVRGAGEHHLAAAAVCFGTKKESPSSVRGGDPPAKRVGGAGENHLAAADDIGTKKRPSSVRGGETLAKRVRGVGEPHLAAAAADNIGNKKPPCPRSDKDPKGSTRRDAAMIKNRSVDLPRHLPESTEQTNPSSISMSDLIEKARQAKSRSAAAEEAIEIECRRTDARRKVELIVATVEFNDPFLDPADVFMSRDQLREAREVAYAAQARIIEKARRREMEGIK